MVWATFPAQGSQSLMPAHLLQRPVREQREQRWLRFFSKWTELDMRSFVHAFIQVYLLGTSEMCEAMFYGSEKINTSQKSVHVWVFTTDKSVLHSTMI